MEGRKEGMGVREGRGGKGREGRKGGKGGKRKRGKRGRNVGYKEEGENEGGRKG